MDIGKFQSDFKGIRIRKMIDYCESQTSWFDFQQASDFLIKEAKTAIHQAGNKESNGHPSSVKNCFFHLIKIGYLIADPQKGLKRNPDFMPRNQR